MFKNLQGNIFGPTSEKHQGNYVVSHKNNNVEWFKGSARLDSDGKDNQSLQSFLDKKILWVWLGILIFGLLVLFGRIFYLQMIEGKNFKAIAEGNRVRIRDIKSTRGVIYDRNENLLAKNIPNFSLAVIPVDVPREEEQFEKIINYLAQISGRSFEELSKTIKDQPLYSYQPVVIKDNLDFEQAVMIKIESFNYPGVILKADSRREYLEDESTFSFSHILGYLGKINPANLEYYLNNDYSLDDQVGIAGVESIYEKELKGKNGKEYVEVDALGRTKKVISYQKPVDGKNLVLTIDLELQKVAEKSLADTMASFGKKKGVVIALNPNTGEVLALVSLPTFNNNLFINGISSAELNNLFNNPDLPLFNRAVSGEYPSGSTFKMIIAAAALQEGIIDSRTSFNSVGGIRISSWFFPDWKAGGHGWTNVIKALAESVNTFFYIVGGGYDNFEGLGVEKIKDYAEMFGLNKKTGIDLPNEASGFVPTQAWKEETKNEVWYIGDTYHLAIGQGDILASPLQIALWTSVFANGGKLYQPYLAKGFLDEQGNIQNNDPKLVSQNFINPENIKIVNQGLRQSVLSGSSRLLSGLTITSAAKTGTSQWSSTKDPHAWITAFAPYENPEIVVTVLVEEGGEGSSVAAPVVYKILNWWALNR